MKTQNQRLKGIGLAAALLLFLGGATTAAKAAPVANWDRDTSWEDVRSFARFLDVHPQAAADLWRHPKLVRKERWCYAHPEFQEWARYNSHAAEELRENPNGFMNRVRDFEARERHGGPYRDWDRDRY